MDLVIDLETMSTDPNAAIVGIGACTFDLDSGEIIDTFYSNITLASNLHANRHISAGTIEWWLTQSEEARVALLSDRVQLTKAISKLQQWAPVAGLVDRVWANDCDFDVVILRQAYQAIQMSWPYGFWCNRSMRTIGDLALPDRKERKAIINHFRGEGTHHNALDDAVAQAKFIHHCFHLLERRST